ncbi:MAG: UDP-N-acetyl-alpha-D-glucosamine C6 dehydratase [Chloroflexi bacterium ADurb.Bin325]|nr:MAG: UDP-N-acetyl-alpha-D-glucosamine C6 dehydratase [Chloroflexi bacterium ADurb.Bin325]
MPRSWPAQLLFRVRNRHLVAADLLLVPMAALLAFALRLDGAQLQPYVPTMLAFVLAAPIIKIPIFSVFGIYSRAWQYAGLDEMILLVWSAALGALVQGAFFFGAQALFPEWLSPGIPRSIPFIDGLMTLAVIAGPRFALRVGALSALRARKGGSSGGPLQHVLIVGAGEAGAMVLRELRQNPQTGLTPVGFVDDDPLKHGMLLQRVRILGGRERIPDLVREHHVEQVIIAMPSAAGAAIREIVEICESAGVRARTVPGIYELLGDTVRLRLQQLRDVQIDDLLRRAPIQTDTAQVAALLRGRRVLVTGAGGSIGSELCRQILRCKPASLILLGHGENSIFDIHNELKIEDSRLKMNPAGPQSAIFDLQSQLAPVIADIRFSERLDAVFAEHRPEIVFHAAAHKHVPLMEENVADAVLNNILGTQRVVEASIAAGVERFVLISTDKAVNPTSIMGVTKHIAELIVEAAARETGRSYVAVRFGNVLGSRGSVVPFFQRQIAAGGPVTVTHPDMRRYFMTIPEAVQLVLQAAALGHGGEVFVLDMGEPVRIVDLARDLIRLSGLEPEHDIEIRFTGMRPGEKLFEELFAADEHYGRTEHEKIFVAQNGRHDDLRSEIERLIAAAYRGDTAALDASFHALVPTYQHDEALSHTPLAAG